MVTLCLGFQPRC